MFISRVFSVSCVCGRVGSEISYRVNMEEVIVVSSDVLVMVML